MKSGQSWKQEERQNSEKRKSGFLKCFWEERVAEIKPLQTNKTSKPLLWNLEGPLWVFSRSHSGVMFSVKPITSLRKTDDIVLSFPLRNPGWQDVVFNIYWITEYFSDSLLLPCIQGLIMFHKNSKIFWQPPRSSERRKKWFKVLKLSVIAQSCPLSIIFRQKNLARLHFYFSVLWQKSLKF